jgi:hypothetical protein
MEEVMDKQVKIKRAMHDRIKALQARVAAADKLAELCRGFNAGPDSQIGRALAAYENSKGDV